MKYFSTNILKGKMYFIYGRRRTFPGFSYSHTKRNSFHVSFFTKSPPHGPHPQSNQFSLEIIMGKCLFLAWNFTGMWLWCIPVSQKVLSACINWSQQKSSTRDCKLKTEQHNPTTHTGLHWRTRKYWHKHIEPWIHFELLPQKSHKICLCWHMVHSTVSLFGL